MSSSSIAPSPEYEKRSIKDIKKALDELAAEKDDERYEIRIGLVEFVKAFAVEHNLTIYGGTAIHEHLRSKGLPGIYGDKEAADIDMLSSDSECFARLLADSLTDVKDAKYIEARESRVHDNTFSIKSMEAGDLADISYMSRDSLLALKRFPSIKPYAPIEFLLYAFHAEFAKTQREPKRWEKLFPRFLQLLNAFPFEFEKNEKSREKIDSKLREKVIAEIAKANKIDGSKRPIVGSTAVAHYCEAFQVAFERDSRELPLVEVISTDPEGDAEKFMSLPMFRGAKLSKPEEEETTKMIRETKVREFVISLNDSKVLSFIEIRNCLHYVDSYGGIETCLFVLFRRLLFGKWSSELKSALRGQIGLLYTCLFREKGPKKWIRTFERSHCIGEENSYGQLLVDKFEQKRVIRAYWPWKEEERARRRGGSQNRCEVLLEGGALFRKMSKSAKTGVLSARSSLGQSRAGGV